MLLPYLAIVLLALAAVYSGMVSFRKIETAASSWIFPDSYQPARENRRGHAPLDAIDCARTMAGPERAAYRPSFIAVSNPQGDPPALPGRQQKFDKSGSGLRSGARRPVRDLPCRDSRNRLPFASAPFVQLGILTLTDCDQAPLRGPQS